MPERYIHPDNAARVIVPSDLIGAQEACALLGIDRSTLTRWIQSGSARPLAQLDGPGGAYVFDRTDVEAQARNIQAATTALPIIKKGPGEN
ncbi:DNA binding protein [Arthrobacter phage Noely]|uniref:DNA binding protein n=1 Tax=Arthrobacter phage Noely TaxID=2419964 RepID=A0A3G2KAF7_9CAUD|nr:DNA binding protein [Arthrobacter phage Noely]AYN55958.1 DNA binding protein [Arthrobacter phage Noely]